MRLSGVNKSYKNQVVFENMNLEITKPGVYGVVGLSGSGKSTLLNMLYGIDMAYDGEYLISDSKVKDIKLSDHYNDNISIVFQDTKLLEHLNVIDNLKLANKTNCDMDNLLEKFNILDLKEVKVKYLSGGEKQRLAFARAIMNDPKIILLDEPTAALDDTNASFIIDTIKSLGDDKVILVISHDERIIENLDVVYELKDCNINLIKGSEVENTNSDIELKSVSSNKKSLIKIAHKNLWSHKKTLIPSMLAMLILTTIFALMLLNTIPYMISDTKEYIENGETTTIAYYKPTQKYSIDVEDYNEVVEIVGEENVELNESITDSFYLMTLVEGATTVNEATLDFADVDKADYEYLLDQEVSLSYGTGSINGYLPFDPNDIIGEMPTSFNEVVVPSYLAQIWYGNDDYNALIGETIEYNYTYNVYPEGTTNYELVEPEVVTIPLSFRITGVYPAKISNAAYKDNLEFSIEAIKNGEDAGLSYNIHMYNAPKPYYELSSDEQEQVVELYNILVLPFEAQSEEYTPKELTAEELTTGATSLKVTLDYNDPEKEEKINEINKILDLEKYELYQQDYTKKDLLITVGFWIAILMFGAIAFAIILGVINLMNLRMRKDEFAKYYLIGYTNKKILPALGLEFMYMNLIIVPIAVLTAIHMYKNANPQDILPHLSFEILLVIVFTLLVNLFIILWYAIVNRRGKILQNLREGK